MDKKAIAKKIIDKFLSAGAEKVQCVVSNSIVTEFNFESGIINLIRTNYNTTIGVKALKGNKKSMAQLNSVEEADIDAAVASAMASMEASLPDPAEDISDEKADSYFESGIFEPDMDKMYDRLIEYTETVKKDYPKISINSITFEHRLTEHLVTNTNGTCLESKQGYYSFSPMFMAVADGKTSSFNAYGQLFTDINEPIINYGLGKTLLSENEKSLDTKGIDGKFIGDIIVSPACVPDFLGSVYGNFLSDGVLINGTSLLKDKLGEKIASSLLTWSLIPLSNEKTDMTFYTGDGYLTENMNIIENGVLKSFMLSRYGAAKTGNSRCKGLSENYKVNPGSTPLNEMIAGTKQGIVLNRFSGGAPGSDGDITGVAKNSFRIQDGKVTDALSEVMFSGNLLKMLTDISEISIETVNDGISIYPYIKIKDVTISGK